MKIKVNYTEIIDWNTKPYNDRDDDECTQCSVYIKVSFFVTVDGEEHGFKLTYAPHITLDHNFSDILCVDYDYDGSWDIVEEIFQDWDERHKFEETLKEAANLQEIWTEYVDKHYIRDDDTYYTNKMVRKI